MDDNIKEFYMPYIKKGRRELFDPAISVLSDRIDNSNVVAGDMNYIITKLLNKYLSVHGEKYSTYNDIIGLLECCKMEYYRRRCSPYEDIKIAENGDV